MEYYSTIKKKERMPFRATWVDLEISYWVKEGRQRGRNIDDIPYLWNLKRNDTNELTKQKDIDLENELMVASTHCYILNGLPTRPYCIEHRELCLMCWGSLDRSEIWGRTDTWIWMAESLHCSPETITTLLIRYTTTQNKKLKKKPALGCKKPGKLSSQLWMLCLWGRRPLPLWAKRGAGAPWQAAEGRAWWRAQNWLTSCRYPPAVAKTRACRKENISSLDS